MKPIELVLLWILGSYVATAETVSRIAVVGDFGSDGDREARVARLVKSWSHSLSAVVGLGDCNYPRGSWLTIDENVGKHYQQFIKPYVGKYGKGSPDHNRFWPCPGNHDYGNRRAGNLEAYLRYMPVQGRHFYDVRIGPVHLFSLDSDLNQDRLNGTDVRSRQAHWLRRRLAASQAPWKVVFFHHPPHSSGSHGPSHHMRWPFREWGATTVLSGHDHTYERIIDPESPGSGPGFPYFVNGMGGARTYGFNIRPTVGSAARFTGIGGAQLLEADESRLTIRFISADNKTRDCYAAWRLQNTSRLSTAAVNLSAAMQHDNSSTQGCTDSSFGAYNVEGYAQGACEPAGAYVGGSNYSADSNHSGHARPYRHQHRHVPLGGALNSTWHWLQHVHRHRHIAEDIQYGECSRMPDVTSGSLTGEDARRAAGLFSIPALGDPLPGQLPGATDWVRSGQVGLQGAQGSRSAQAVAQIGQPQPGIASMLRTWWQGFSAGRKLMPEASSHADAPGVHFQTKAVEGRKSSNPH